MVHLKKNNQQAKMIQCDQIREKFRHFGNF